MDTRGYIGVDPAYRNYANETEKPLWAPHEEVRLAEKGILSDDNADKLAREGEVVVGVPDNVAEFLLVEIVDDEGEKKEEGDKKEETQAGSPEQGDAGGNDGETKPPLLTPTF